MAAVGWFYFYALVNFVDYVLHMSDDSQHLAVFLQILEGVNCFGQKFSAQRAKPLIQKEGVYAYVAAVAQKAVPTVRRAVHATRNKTNDASVKKAAG